MESTCELRVDQVSSEKVIRKQPIEKSFLGKSKAFKVNIDSPYKGEALQIPGTPQGQGQTKSEFQFPINQNKHRK